ncbi:MAG: DUF1616 domain-containing protein [Candidatus Lokiarchaeota archaeon]|nr:DUF1616 domain-containing protein [Candidatus Lokiarchaeota archaeon]
MFRVNERQDSKELNRNYKEFDKLLKLLLIIGIIVISGFIAYAVFTPRLGYITTGLLNSEKKAENYPTITTTGENVTFYVSVANYLNRDFSFRLEILRGDNNTLIGPAPSVNAYSYVNLSTVNLHHGKDWISSSLNVSFSQPGNNQTIIVEIWEMDGETIKKFWDILTLHLNVTS